MKSYSRYICMIYLGLAGFPVPAEEPNTVYESVSQIDVGQVFFSLNERAAIDGNSPSIRSVMNAEQRRPQRSRFDSAGFFVRTDGEARIYREGDFVPGAVTDEVRFSGNVIVRKHSSDDASNDETEKESNDAAAMTRDMKPDNAIKR